MNHHLAIKSHAWSCNSEHTKKKHWLVHAAVSEHSTFPCEMSVMLGRVRCTSAAKLEECSWWIYPPTSRQTENLPSVQPEGGKKKKKRHFSCTVWDRLCPSGWSGTCCHLQLWLLHCCSHLQCGQLPTGIWRETPNCLSFKSSFLKQPS